MVLGLVKSLTASERALNEDTPSAKTAIAAESVTINRVESGAGSGGGFAETTMFEARGLDMIVL